MLHVLLLQAQLHELLGHHPASGPCFLGPLWFPVKDHQLIAEDAPKSLPHTVKQLGLAERFGHAVVAGQVA